MRRAWFRTVCDAALAMWMALLVVKASESQSSEHWAFQPLRRPLPPPGCTPIDGFVAAKLSEAGLNLSPSAERRELIRRAYFDLIGLPPAPEEVHAFERDESPDAFEKVIDRLLASPHYGERWGRHWLDLVRFAQSNGYERDGEKLLAWRYRDYVIKAFNEDKPYDRFITEQLAGDELPDGTADSVAATAFQRLGVFDDEPDDKQMAEFDALDDVLSTTGTTFLGLTLGCARCHDHKFDPLPQTEYYSLLAFFRGVRPFESSAPNFDSPGFAPLASPSDARRWRADLRKKIEALQAEIASTKEEAHRKELEAEIARLKQESPFAWTLAVRESGPKPPATFILKRGNAATPGAEVQPAFPRAVAGCAVNFPEAPPNAGSSGRRLALAKWVASAENPLSARVLVNRLWQHHFGEGLVKTASDFGRAGAPPSHPELLDWLASEFIAHRWSIKHMHKLIMLSAAYQQSSHTGNAKALAVDPGNRLLWRQNLRRLEAECIRDTVLSVAGLLNSQMGGRGFFPHLSGEVLAGQSRPGLDWDVSSPAEQARRGVYAFVRRTMGVPLFEAFDYNNTTSPVAERPVTTVAPQSLILLNDPAMHQAAAAFAERAVRIGGGSREGQVRAAYSLAFNRAPVSSEIEAAEAFLGRNEKAFAELCTELTFQLDVANALSTDYFEKLAPAQFLLGPANGWSYYRGVWAPPYEGIRVVQREQGPFALWDGATFSEGTVEGTISFSKSCEFAAILFRGSQEQDRSSGCEVVLNRRTQQVQLRRVDKETQILAEAPFAFEAGERLPFKIEAMSSGIRVWLGPAAKPLIESVDEHAAESGRVGFRVWGGPASLDKLRVSTAAAQAPISVGGGSAAPKRRAIEAFCLLLLNLNELIYID